MKIKRHFAPDMKTALRLVREEQGPDAVILSTRRTGDGVEVVSAAEVEAGFMEPAPGHNRVGTGGDTGQVAMPRDAAAPSSAAVEWVQDPLLREMREELSTLRELVQHQFTRLALREAKRVDPFRLQLRRYLRRLGLSGPVVTRLLGRLSQAGSLREARREALAHLTEMIPVHADDPLAEGGILALIGPTGAGKTTTLAKLAARVVRRHGPDRLALVTTDSLRVGAESQLGAYARILGVPLHRARDAGELQRLLKAFDDRRLVLIDTAGLRGRDVRSEDLHALLAESRRVRTFFVAAASAQPASMVRMLAGLPQDMLSGSVLTKIDEVESPAEVLSLLIERRLPLTWICEGPHVPRDLRRARASELAGMVMGAASLAPARRHDSLAAESLDMRSATA